MRNDKFNGSTEALTFLHYRVEALVKENKRLRNKLKKCQIHKIYIQK